MEEGKATTPDETKINYRGLKAMPFIIGNESFEKLGTFGTSMNLVVYLTTVFNMKRVSAAILVNIFNGTTFFTPLIGAFLADTFFGRYKTLGFTSIISLIGMFLVMLTALVPKFHPPSCETKKHETCIGPTASQLTVLLCALGFLVIGAGGIRSCNLAFGADQFNPNTESGKKAINSFINWYFFVYSSTMMVSLTLIIYVQSNISWTIGLAIPPSLMFLACVLFFTGSRVYVKVKPEGSPLTSIIQVLVAATKKRHLRQPDNPQISLFNHFQTNSLNSKLGHTDQFKFLDKAALITDEDQIDTDGSAANPWSLCSMQQVEEVKCIVRVIPIWASSAIYHITQVQQYSYAVFQALQSDRRLGKGKFEVPAASYIAFYLLSLAIWIPIYDRLIVPSLRKLTGKESGITLLQRMGIGVFLSMMTMLISGLVEQRRRHFAPTRATPGFSNGSSGGAISSMSGLWLIPQLVVMGLSEGFNAIGQVEFYYKQFPENMRSIAVSFFFLGMAVGNYISGFMVSIVHRITEGSMTGNWLPEDLNEGKLDYFYFMIAVIQFVNFVYFLACSMWYRYKGSNSTTPLN